MTTSYTDSDVKRDNEMATTMKRRKDYWECLVLPDRGGGVGVIVVFGRLGVGDNMSKKWKFLRSNDSAAIE
jgi:hypothetical protein